MAGERKPKDFEKALEEYLLMIDEKFCELDSLNRLINFSGFLRKDIELQSHLGLNEVFVGDVRLYETDAVGRHRNPIQLPIFQVINLNSPTNTVILGAPGSGKTTILKEIGTRLVALTKTSRTPRIPIFVRIIDLHKKMVLEDRKNFSQILYETAFPLEEITLKEYEKLRDNNKLVFLLDGLDEIASSFERGKIRDQIIEFMRAYRGNLFFITSRTTGYEDAQIPPRCDAKYLELGGLQLSAVSTLKQKLNHIIPKNNGYEADESISEQVGRNPLLITLETLLHKMGKRIDSKNRYQLFKAMCSLIIETRFPASEDNYRFTAIWEFLKRIAPLYNEKEFSSGIDAARLNLEFQQTLKALTEASDSTHPSKPSASSFKVKAVRDELNFNDIINHIGLLVKNDDSYNFLHKSFQDYFEAAQLQQNYPYDSSYEIRADFWKKQNDYYTLNNNISVLAFLAEAPLPLPSSKLVFDDFQNLLEQGELSDEFAWPTFYALIQESELLRETAAQMVPQQIKNFLTWGTGIQQHFEMFQKFLGKLYEFLKKGSDHGDERLKVTFQSLRNELLELAKCPEDYNFEEALKSNPSYLRVVGKGYPVYLLANETLASVNDEQAKSVMNPLKISPREDGPIKLVIAGEDEGPLNALDHMIKANVIRDLLSRDAFMLSRGWQNAEIEIYRAKKFEPQAILGGLYEEYRNGVLSIILQPHRFLGFLAHHNLVAPIQVDQKDRDLFYNYNQYCSYGLCDYGYPFSALSMYVCYRKDLISDTSVQTQFKERYGYGFRYPENILEYLQIASFFTQNGTIDQIDNSKSRNTGSIIEGQVYGTSIALNPSHAAMWYEWLNFIYAEGGGVLENKAGWEYGDIIVNSPKTEAGTRNYLELVRYSPHDALNRTWNQVKEDFISGQVFMCLIWTDQIHDVYKQMKQQGIEIDFFMLPSAKTSPQLESWSFYIPTTSPNKIAALEFIKWFSTSIDVQKEYFKRGGAPPLKSFYSDTNVKDFSTEYPYLKTSQRVLNNPGVQKETIPESDIITHEILDAFKKLLTPSLLGKLRNTNSPPGQVDSSINKEIRQTLEDIANQIYRVTGGKSRSRTGGNR